MFWLPNFPTKIEPTLIMKYHMCDILKKAHYKGWIASRDGNVSCRLGDTFLITPSGALKHSLQVADILQGEVLAGTIGFKNTVKPSGEFHMHEALQRTEGAESGRAVVHLHPTYTIAAMLAGWDLRDLAKRFEEVSRYTRVAPNVPIVSAVSRELAKETYLALTGGNIAVYDIVGQKNHGVCAVAETPQKAFEHIERLEHVCQIVLASGIKPR